VRTQRESNEVAVRFGDSVVPAASNGVAEDADGVGLDWEQILVANMSWLRRVLYARLGELEAVEECLQEVGLAAVRQAAPIRDPARVGSWLYQLAIRQSLLYRRKMGRRRNLLNRYATRFEPSESDQGAFDPLQWLMDRERAVVVRAALAELKEEDREIMLLKYAESWSYGQISEHLGVSHSAVEARLHRARQRLRKLIERREMLDP
jgi:RNA polymerase sigma factor (sigma-70 family)